MSVDVKVKGLAELTKALKDFPDKIQASVLRSAMRDGAKVLKEEVKANLARNDSVSTGELRDGVKISMRSRRGRITASVRAGGPRAGDGPSAHGFIAYWLEFTGAAPHLIKAKKKRFLLVFGQFMRVVHHPGFKPKPFMRPALHTKAQDALLAVGNRMKAQLSKKGVDTSSLEVRSE